MSNKNINYFHKNFNRLRCFRRKFLMIFFSFIIIIIVQTVFCFFQLRFFQPSLIALMLIYWITIFPNQINIGTGFCCGLILDLINESILGICALSFSILSYIIKSISWFFKNMKVWQQSLFVMLLSLLNKFIIFFLKFLIIDISFSSEIFYNGILDGFVWPIVLFLMNKYINIKINN